jgi:hypothetical protein
MNSLKILKLKPLMEIIEESVEGAADEAERRWIANFRSKGCRLINYTSGGENGFTMSEELRAKFRILNSRKRRPMSDEHRAKISDSLKGRELTPGNGKYFSALNIKRKGIPLREETKAKLREIGRAQLNGKWFERFIEGCRNRKRPSKFTDEQKSEIKFLISEGYSQKIIAETFGICIGTVSDAKRGKIWAKIIPATSASIVPEFKSVPLVRNEKGQYERAA